MSQRINNMEGTLRLRGHTVHLEEKNLLNVTGVKDVTSFNEEHVQLLTELGDMHVDGKGLHITKLNLDDGQVMVEGIIDAIEYEETPEARGGVFSRLFR